MDTPISITSALGKTFEFTSREPELYRLWEESGCFKPETALDQKAPVFNISMPPPNANGELHLGHAFGYSVMDILGRFHRLRGKRVLLLPGKDHAGIQTQVVFEKKLKSEGVDPKGKEIKELYDSCYAFCVDRAQYMRSQEKTLGLSADWSRELFTLDPRLNEIVFETFVQLWNDGLVYRGNRIVNWSVFSQTAISDVEVEYREQEGNLWHVNYAEPGIVVATTRPETMLGDTALAVHPEDDRYKQLIGTVVTVPLVGRKIPIVGDRRVDPSFGSGVVKVTPAHDFLDYDIGVDQKLEIVQVIGKDGLMTEAAGAAFRGLKIIECREKVLEQLKAEGRLLKTEPMRHKVPIGERGKDIIEPLISEQWFIAVDKPGKSLKGHALEMLRSGRISIHPERFRVLFEQWLENLRDWNISRQLWWGHRLPVWYRTTSQGVETYVGTAAPRGEGWEQDPDVFDTWFSSGQWAYSTIAAHKMVGMKLDDNRSDFFPTHTMVMGRDILFFWACRMLLLTSYRMKQVPWKNIFFTGLIRDEHGQKMSKSKGNGIEPNEMISKYGSDSLRLAMVMGASAGNDISFAERKVEGYSKFINKLWNAAKLIELKTGTDSVLLPSEISCETNRWILGELAQTRELVAQKIEEYELSVAADELYRFTWTVFCDWYLEMMKVLIDKGQAPWQQETKAVSQLVLGQLLAILHPFIPFVTEEIYQALTCVRDGKLLAGSRWDRKLPVSGPSAAELPAVMEVIGAVRSVKAALNIPHKEIRLATTVNFGAEYSLLITALARVALCKESEISAELALRKPFSGGSIICEVEGKEKYRERLEKDIAGHRGTVQNIESKLSGSFATQAKPEVVEKERERLAQSKAAIAELEKELVLVQN